MIKKDIKEKSPGVFILRSGDIEFDYDLNFRMYLTSKLSNPKFMAEVHSKVSIIDFTVNLDGL